MDRVVDPRLVQILATRGDPSLPADVAERAYRLARLLLAAHEWRDITVFTMPMPCGDRFAAPVVGKWVVVFVWVAGAGARDLALQRQ
jgi:hypothetical protein